MIFSPNERYLHEFSRSGPLFFIPLGMLRWQPIVGKICKMTYIQHAGISQRSKISQFRFRGDNGHNFCYILCNFGEDRSTNPRDLAGSFCTFWDEMAKIDISNISASTGPNFANFPVLVRSCMQIIQLK